MACLLILFIQCNSSFISGQPAPVPTHGHPGALHGIQMHTKCTHVAPYCRARAARHGLSCVSRPWLTERSHQHRVVLCYCTACHPPAYSAAPGALLPYHECCGRAHIAAPGTSYTTSSTVLQHVHPSTAWHSAVHFGVSSLASTRRIPTQSQQPCRTRGRRWVQWRQPTIVQCRVS